MLGKFLIRLFPREYCRTAEEILTLVKHHKRVSCHIATGYYTRNVRSFVPADVGVVINSYGGVMTTTLEHWIAQWKKVNLMERRYSKEDRNSYALKHAPHPPISTNRRLRLVYVFGDPILSVLSVLGKEDGRPAHHYSYVSENEFTYRTLAMRIKTRSIKAYLASDLGAFPIRQHFHNWRKEPTQHPILFIRCETIWDNLDVLQSFLGLPAGAMNCFPEKEERESSRKLLDLSPREREKLDQLYGEFSEEIKQMPDTEIRPADWFV